MDEIEEIEEKGEYTADDLARIGAKWNDRIKAAEKREEKWIKSAAAAEKAYLVDEDAADGVIPEFNIVFSNIETIVPSIYNSTPVPDIRPRHNNKDDIGKEVADILERAISTLIDDDRLDAEVEKVAQDAFLAGRGVLRIKFDADVQQIIDPMTMMPVPQIANERVIYEVVSWRDYREGPAKRWTEVPWVAFRHVLSHEQLEKIEDEELAELQVDPDYSEGDEEQDVSVWEIWCKDSGRVYFVVEDSGKVLRVQDDPLGLAGFFPMPEPVQPVTGTGQRVPVCPYAIYKTLAEELDRQTRRINAIIKGLKVRGAIAADAEAIELIARADDNELVPVPNIENLAAVGGLEKAIMWWPIDRAVQVLRELYAQREQTKQTIYEITGISDVIRGASKSNETATAQQIKTEWGSLRIKKMQRLIERHVRDIFVITSEIISQHFSFETLQKMSGIQIRPETQQLLGRALDHYRIDVESDSTVRADMQKSRGEMSEFLNGTASFFSTMAPIAQQSPGAIAPIVEMYASFARQFNLGRSAEGALDQLAQMAQQAAQQPPPNPEAERMKAEMEFEQHKFQAEQQGKMEDRQLKLVGLQLDNQLKQADLALKRQQLQLDEAKAEFDAVKSAVEMEMEEDQQRAVKFGSDI